MTKRESDLSGVVYGLGLAFFAAYQQFKLPVVLPVLLAEYGYDRTLAGAFMSIYALAGLLLSLLVGRAIDKHGAAAPILLAMALVTIGSTSTLLAPDNGLLVLAGRGLEGIAFTILAISGPVLANANASPKQIGIVIGLTAAWIPVGQLTAIVLAPLALTTLGWQLLWILAIAGSLAFTLWTMRLRASRTSVLTHCAKTTAKETVDIAHPISPEQRTRLLIAGAIFMLWSGQYFAYMTWLPQYLVDVHQVRVATALWGYATPVVLVIGFCLVSGVLLRSGVSVGPLMLIALVTQAGVWWMLPFTDTKLGGMLSLVVYGCGAGVVPTCLFAMPSTILGRTHGTVQAFAIIMTGRNLGVLIGPVLLAYAFTLSGTWRLASPIFGTVTTLCLCLGIVLALQLRRSRRVWAS